MCGVHRRRRGGSNFTWHLLRNNRALKVHHISGCSKRALQIYSHSFRVTSDKSPACQLESGDSRCVKAINNSNNNKTSNSNMYDGAEMATIWMGDYSIAPALQVLSGQSYVSTGQKGLQMRLYKARCTVCIPAGFQARSKDQEILEEGGGAGPSLLPRRDHE